MIIVGSITGNSNTIGGGLVLPLADLGRERGERREERGLGARGEKTN